MAYPALLPTPPFFPPNAPFSIASSPDPTILSGPPVRGFLARRFLFPASFLLVGGLVPLQVFADDPDDLAGEFNGRISVREVGLDLGEEGREFRLLTGIVALHGLGQRDRPGFDSGRRPAPDCRKEPIQHRHVRNARRRLNVEKPRGEPIEIGPTTRIPLSEHLPDPVVLDFVPDTPLHRTQLGSPHSSKSSP